MLKQSVNGGSYDPAHPFGINSVTGESGLPPMAELDAAESGVVELPAAPPSELSGKSSLDRGTAELDTDEGRGREGGPEGVDGRGFVAPGRSLYGSMLSPSPLPHTMVRDERDWR